MSTAHTDDEAARDDLIGRTIGHYEILRELGRGGMATVYLARQTNMNRQVAIKILPREFLHDPQFIERFKREVQLIAELEHPHILPVYDFGEIDRIPFIVMRYLAGGSLRDWLDQGLPPLADLERPIEQVCAALDFAHGEGIIHRDLKPSNIMLDERDNAYLSDFGIAQIMQDAGRLTGSAVIGTPAYMSPEQAEGRPLDARSDVYAMGVVLFEMVTGREPFQADTPMAMLLKQISEPMPSPRAYRPGLPESIERVILRATLKDPAGRYPSAGDLAWAFSRALGQLTPDQSSVRVKRSTFAERTYVPGESLAEEGQAVYAPEDSLATTIGDEAVPATPPPTPPSLARAGAAAVPTPAAALPRPARRRLGLWAALAVILLAAIGGGALAITGNLPFLATPADTPGPPPTLAPPTPFRGANTYRGPENVYQISIPGGWQREDRSGEGALNVLWYDAGLSAFAGLQVSHAGAEGAGQFDQAVEQHTGDHFGDARLFTPIDRAPQPDGSLRVSYRVPQPAAVYGRFGPGQLDLFYYQIGPYFIVVEVFTADGADVAALLPLLQDVLDSVYVDPSADWEAVIS